jgi:prophage regulatory protein
MNGLDQESNQQSVVPSAGFMRLPAILAVYPIGRSTWWAGVRSGRYPAPVKLGPRITAWRVEEIRALLRDGEQTAPERPRVTGALEISARTDNGGGR